VTLENGRISYYGSHTDDSPRYVLNMRGCGVRDDGWKRNRRHVSKTKGDPPLDEPGAYFFLFSIYHRPDSVRDQDDQDDSEIVPLLRFSTPSHAERSQWIQLISEACAYCETDAFVESEASRVAELALQLQEQAQMASAMPEAKEGTLPPLYFAPGKAKHSRHQSFSKLPSAKLFRTKSKNFDADKVDARSTKGYPPSKPMHRATAPSYLSVEAPVQNYRGFFNLGIIVLLVSNFRLILGTVQRHGFVLNRVVEHYRDLPHISRDPWEEFPFVSGILLQLVFITIAYAIEWLLSRKKLSESIGMILHQINAHSAFAVPMGIVWNFIDKPPIGATLLLHATITWMKLISYIHANEDYRLSSRQKDVDSHTATLALVENLDPTDEHILYPQNVTLRNMFYYWFAPTLTYQIAFPKSPRIRIWKIVGILVRMVGAVALFTFLAAQVVGPALESLLKDLEATNGTYTVGILADYWLRLSIANTYLWLIVFYFYFHLYLNLFAEILRFGDRVFYKDWWNSSEVSAYWRLWNMPVHYWLIRHVYFPCIRLKMSKVSATFVVFLLSAVMHEVLVSVPFHMVRPWSFLGMMMQMPLVAATKFLYRKYPGSSIGNFIFW
jgi:diacylglycerol O-acyltransferase-1